jgi:hypothetical protein
MIVVFIMLPFKLNAAQPLTLIMTHVAAVGTLLLCGLSDAAGCLH